MNDKYFCTFEYSDGTKKEFKHIPLTMSEISAFVDSSDEDKPIVGVFAKKAD